MTDVAGALLGGEMMITVGLYTVGLYCEVEDPDKFSEPFLFHLLGDSGGPFEFETRQQAETFLLNHGVSQLIWTAFCF